jgi:signal transduction histidine kinase
MSSVVTGGEVLDEGTITFSIESRIVRELGERLVKQPDVALVELIKNAYDADATLCEVTNDPPRAIQVVDDGHGMTLDEFKSGWMRIGTSIKETERYTPGFRRVITGEKGIGRFAVRFLGRALELESIAQDDARGFPTLLTAHFDWPTFDNTEDLGKVAVPYKLVRAAAARHTGTTLRISQLRPAASTLNLDSVRTASITVVTPYRALLRDSRLASASPHRDTTLRDRDPGFVLKLEPGREEGADGDVARAVLDNAVLRAMIELSSERVSLRVYRRGKREPVLSITDRYPNSVGGLYADIRFFPQRKGTFAGLPVKGPVAKSWVKQHPGVAVFDRTFRVLPYGMPGDDWLRLAADAARRAREPRSSIAIRHFPMDEPTRTSTQLNYMLRLPYPEQLVGIVQVEGRRSADQKNDDEGLIAAADREGFIDNVAFRQLFDVVRGAIEAIATADRELQQEQERSQQEALIRSLRKETRAAIREVQANPAMRRADKERIVKRLAETQALAERHEDTTREQQASLGVMSLLGVVAGFMTHEFGAALDELEKAQRRLAELARRRDEFAGPSREIQSRLVSLRDFVTYSQGYIQGASARPTQPYPVRPRIRQVVRVFGKYAEERDIKVTIEVDADLVAPLVPVSLYNGIALNLFTNALKAVTAKAGSGARDITFRAWNEPRWHYLEVSDTGIGIPVALRDRVFDPLFTTTATNRDPLGSGMGLGLALVKRGVESYGGRAQVTDPPAGFSTCVRIRLPLVES